MLNIPGIQEYFNGKNVFITGGTGFVGKVLIEKLLRSCPGIDKIFLLIRSKKGISCNKRLQSLLNSKIFSLRLNLEEIKHKVIGVEGDLTEHRLGLNEFSRKVMIEDINVIFHVAGIVKFTETIKEAVNHNLFGTKNVIDFVKECKRVEAFLHVSTTYTYCHRFDCGEELYPMKVTPNEMMDACKTMTDQELESLIRPLLEGRPNNYTFVKALAEHLVHDEKPDNVGVAILRPSIVVPAYEEPVPGWVDAYQGTTFIITFGALGIMRTLDMDGSTLPSLIPVDMFCNSLIASAWYLGTHRPNQITIYNVTTEPHNSITYYDYIEIVRAEQFNSPSINALRPFVPVPKTRPSRVNLAITSFFAHFLFSYFVDGLSYMTRTKPKVVKFTQTMQIVCTNFRYFFTNQWHFRTNNTRNLIDMIKNNSKMDWEIFKFDPDTIDYNYLCKHMWIGIRKYLLNEPEYTIPAAKLRMIKVTYLYRIVLIVWYSFLFYLIYLTLWWLMGVIEIGTQFIEGPFLENRPQVLLYYCLAALITSFVSFVAIRVIVFRSNTKSVTDSGVQDSIIV